MSAMTIVQAVNSAMRVMLARDPTVVVLGQDVGYFGGVFRCTEGLQQIFGVERVLDTPIAEGGIVAAAIGMVPIPIHKEKAGYVLNSLLVPFLNAAGELAAGGYADPQDVDKVWRIATGAPMGPFQIYDIIGLTTPYNILSHGDEKDRTIAAWLKENYIDVGKLGVATGEGFYRYSNDK